MECYISINSSKEVGFFFITAIRDPFMTENANKFKFSLTTFLTGSSEKGESSYQRLKYFNTNK